MQSGWYGEDLAYIHDAGFGDFALGAAPGILEILRRNGTSDGLIVDLGCGSGLWARELAGAHYDVLGLDISEAMIDIARERVSEAEIPACVAVTALGEVLNYLFDPGTDLALLLHRVYEALVPGGLFVFDVAEPGQVARGVKTRGFTEREDWVVLVEKEEEGSLLKRRITTFRREGAHYRRTDETHRQRLYRAPYVAGELRRVGFLVRTTRHYGRFRLPRAHAAFIARKPA